MFAADLHIHSKHSIATGKDCDAPHLDYWARVKGLSVVGTGDFTHPMWRKELREALIPAEGGLYAIKEDLRLDCPVDAPAPKFIVTGEISTIYKAGGKTRKVHHLIILPSLEYAETLARRLEVIGNIHSDGRPILGLDSRDLIKIVFDACPEAIFIPAHIWTPHFSVFGAFSDFSSLEQCYGDMTKHITALETGLSSDPPMNRRVSMLDRYQLVSNSDAHSPARLARECNIFDCDISYEGVKSALETGKGLRGTVEFFPEEGKYHLDGHRNCGKRLTPAETASLGGICPVCGKKLTIGVEHRVDIMADRETPAPGKPFQRLMPLTELLGECAGTSAASKKTKEQYERAITRLGSELYILREAPLADIESACGFPAREAISRLRAGKVLLTAGFDGEYGQVRLFEPGEIAWLGGQMTFTELSGAPGQTRQAVHVEPAPQDGAVGKPRRASDAEPAPLDGADSKSRRVKAVESTNTRHVFAEPSVPLSGVNPEQEAAVNAPERRVAIIAGPGTGKTYTLVERVRRLLKSGVPAERITCVTFTNKAAGELKSRLGNVSGLTVGTFHSICLRFLPKKPLAGRALQMGVAREVLRDMNLDLPLGDDLPDEVQAECRARLGKLGYRDLDGVLLEALEADTSGMVNFENLLVDEYQDINAIQRALIMKWAQNGTLFVIGDPDQSIYGFRGASAECFDELMREMPDIRLITLSRNYRSTPEIVTCAISVISKNTGGVRALMPERERGAGVRLARAESEDAEGAVIVREIARLTGGMDMVSARTLETSAARAFSDIAVICRTRRRLERIEKCIVRAGIPCAVYGLGDSLSDEISQGIMAFFRYLVNPNPPDKALALSAIWGAKDENQPWRDALSVMSAHRDKPDKMLEDFRALTGKKSAMLEKIAVSYADFDSFMAALEAGEQGDLRRISGAYVASGAVSLMTVHGAKGLEFPAVFVSGADEMPYARRGIIEDIAEERRLFYVALTRARDEAIITHTGTETQFMAELPGDVRRESVREKPKYEQLKFL